MIGIFDSGLGGLSVLKHLVSDLSEYDYIYLGDNARVPYGNKSSDLIYTYTCQAVDFLFSQGASLIILACNSASSQALRKLQLEYISKKYPQKNVLGVIAPLVEKVVYDKNISKVAVIGTRATINSRVYSKEIFSLNNNIEVIEKAAPLLVPLIEENWLKETETKMILKHYLRELKMKQVQALILACTHYPFLLSEIRQIMGKSCQVYNPGEIIADSLKNYLNRHSEFKLNKSDKAKRLFFATDKQGNFKQMAERFLGSKIENINYIKLDERI